MPKGRIDEELLIDEIDASGSSADEFDEVFDDIEAVGLATKVSAEETVFDVLKDEDILRRREEAKKRKEILAIKSEAARQNVFLGLKAKERRKKTEEICAIRSDSDNLSRFYSHGRGLQKFILEAVQASKVDWKKTTREQKISFLKQFHAGNTEWMAYLSTAVSICFPTINIYRTKCNPAEFISLILEEVLVPLANLRSEQHMVRWFSNNGAAVEEKMRARMTELLKNRIK